jgi:hypothetical protein
VSSPVSAGAARPEHRYRLADFGLTGGQVDELIPGGQAA